MPIQRYHNRPAGSGNGGLVLLGRLYKGDPKTDPKRPGADREFFRFEPEDHPVLTADEIKAAWVATYGEQPSVIPNVQFAADSIPHVFDEWMEAWGKSGSGTPLLNRRCDGQTCFTERVNGNGRDGGLNRQPQPCICAVQGKALCKQTGRLMMFLPDFIANVGALGVVMLTTHSTTDLDNIRGTLQMFAGTVGRLRNLSFVLHRKPQQLTTPEGAPVVKWIVHLDAGTAAAQQAALAAGDMLALPDGQPALPAPRPTAPALPAPSAPPPAPVYRDEPPIDAVFEDESDAPQAPSTPQRLGVASALVIKDKDGKKRSYALRLDHNRATIALSGFDGLRAIGGNWAEFVDTWKTVAPNEYGITPVTVYRDGSGLFFEASDVAAWTTSESVHADDIPF